MRPLYRHLRSGHGHALTNDEVREIWALRNDEMCGAVAKKFGCGRSCVNDIWNGRTHRAITQKADHGEN